MIEPYIVKIDMTSSTIKKMPAFCYDE